MRGEAENFFACSKQEEKELTHNGKNKQFKRTILLFID